MKKIIFILILFNFSGAVFASNISMDFILKGISARSLGMASSVVAVPNNIDTPLINPGNLPLIKNIYLLSSYYNIKDFDMSSGSFSYIQPIGRFGTIGFALILSQIENIIRTSTNPYTMRGSIEDKFNYSEMGSILSYGFKIKQWLSIGVSSKFLKMQLLKKDSLSYGFDIGTIISPYDFLNIGIGIRNIISSPIGNDVIPQNIKIGFSFERKLYLDNPIILTSELNIQNLIDVKDFRIGIEHNILSIFYIRLGYIYKIDADNFQFFNNTSLGFGLKYKYIGFDYAFLPNDKLGSNNYFSLFLTF